MALAKLSTDRRSRETLEDLLDDSDSHLRAEVARALVELGDPKSRAALAARLEREDDGRVRRKLREALRDLDAGARKEHEQLRDELEKLRAAHAELSAKVAKLEARPKE